MTTGGAHQGLGCPWLLRLLHSLSPTLLQTLGNRQCPNFTSHLLEPLGCQPSPPGFPCCPCPTSRTRMKELGSPGPAPENSPPPPTNCNPVAGIQCSRRNSILGLASRQHNLSPGSPPIIGTQIGQALRADSKNKGGSCFWSLVGTFLSQGHALPALRLQCTADLGL